MIQEFIIPRTEDGKGTQQRNNWASFDVCDNSKKVKKHRMEE